MSRKKPGLVIFVSVYMFLYTFFMLFFGLLLLFMPDEEFSLAAIFPSIFLIGLAILYYKTGRGILRKRNWAKLSATAILGLSFLGGILGLPNAFMIQNVTFMYALGQLFGIAIGTVLAGIGLHAMAYNQSVQNYFNRE